jgi:hypothetical protein
MFALFFCIFFRFGGRIKKKFPNKCYFFLSFTLDRDKLSKNGIDNAHEIYIENFLSLKLENHIKEDMKKYFENKTYESFKLSRVYTANNLLEDHNINIDGDASAYDEILRHVNKDKNVFYNFFLFFQNVFRFYIAIGTS